MFMVCYFRTWSGRCLLLLHLVNYVATHQLASLLALIEPQPNPTTHHQSTQWQLWQVTTYLSSSQAPTCRLNPKCETEDYGCVRNEKFYNSVKKFLVRIFAYSLFGGNFNLEIAFVPSKDLITLLKFCFNRNHHTKSKFALEGLFLYFCTY